MRIRLLILSLLLSVSVLAQQKTKGTLYGKVTDEQHQPLELVNVVVPDLNIGVTTNAKGYYELDLPANDSCKVHFSSIGFEQRVIKVRLKSGENRKLDVTLVSTATNLPDAVISDRATEASSLTRLDAKQAPLLPSMGSGIETLIKTLPGVTSNNEMSSQYKVRGGNFDENLVYVNGIEIYRPFLVGSGQQEGLSFVNSQMVSNIEFSAGGFAAEYGDKMSSVLDVTYKKPREFAGSLTLSLLGADAHLEGASKNDKFSYLVGARYKNTSLVLNMMDTKGSYRPNFGDFQGLFTYQFNPQWELSLLTYYSKNQYALKPTTGTTAFGTFNAAYQLDIEYEGQEVDDYTTGLGALSLSYMPNSNLNLRFIASAYSAYETENYDISGIYSFGQRNTALGSENVGEVIEAHGVGTHIKHARNAFYAQVYNFDHKGTYDAGQSLIKWGLRLQRQQVDDVFDEWQMIDSAGYNLPHYYDSIGFVHHLLPDINLDAAYKSHNKLGLNNADGYFQYSYTIPTGENGETVLTGGLRANYWGFNNKVYVSPRAGIAYRPGFEKSDVVYRLSGGVYNQTPFYRELRNMDGSLYADAEAQRSYQIVLGNDFKFRAWNRPFILTSEAYYKYFTHVSPYDIDDVRIRYYADQTAKAYATGLDFKVNGEFVRGIDSWASLSVMKTREDIQGDYYLVNADGKRLSFYNHADSQVADTVFIGWHDRPSNQLINFSLFFQDYIPNAPTWRVYMTLIFGTRLPVNSKDSDFYTPSYYTRPYRRVDIGFTKQLINEGSSFSKGNPLNYIKNMYVSFEVFNLLNVPNVISYRWVTDYDKMSYAVPNYLSPRYVNLKLVMEF